MTSAAIPGFARSGSFSRKKVSWRTCGILAASHQVTAKRHAGEHGDENSNAIGAIGPPASNLTSPTVLHSRRRERRHPSSVVSRPAAAGSTPLRPSLCCDSEYGEWRVGHIVDSRTMQM